MFCILGSVAKLRMGGAAGSAVPLFAFMIVTLFLAPSISFAASTHVVWGDDDTIVIEDGEIYPVSLQVSQHIYVTRIDGSGYAQFGILYRLTDPSNSASRVRITQVGGFRGVRQLAWAQPGTYEMDVYELPPPIFGNSLWRAVLSLFGVSIAYAQSTDEFIETIRFTITDINDLPKCCSSILFIPGVEGSRLYMNTASGERRVWEPGLFSLQSDARALYLKSDGTSINQIYTKSDAAIDQVDVPLANSTIYKSFLNQLATLKASSTIQDFAVFPYDWRMNPLDIVEHGTQYDDGLHYPSDVVTSLAAQSKTGKVILVGHSNGGLLIKALMLKLEREGHANLVEKIIFVDSPQTGTPKAIASMLHGDFQNLPGWGGFIISKASARALGENMPDAYALLPSDAYFANVATPVVDLTKAPGLYVRSGLSTTTVSNSAQLTQFLTGAGRTKPSGTDIETPDVLSAQLLADAAALHQSIDNWTPPPGIDVIQIAGWGLDTPSKVTYIEKRSAFCQNAIACAFATTTQHVVEMTEDGDRTVVIPSEVTTANWSTFYIDLQNYDKDNKTLNDHSDVTETKVFIELFPLLLSSSSPQNLPFYIHKSRPNPTLPSKSLRLRVLSPVSLDVYDSLGNHTGMAPNPNSQSDLLYKEEQIPGSYYEEFGEGKYIGLLGDENYQVKLHGLDTGTFTFEITPVSGGVPGIPTTFSDIPVTASSTAIIQIIGSTPTSSMLALDSNGDGKVDVTIASSSQLTDPLAYTKLIGTSILRMDIGPAVKIQLIAKLINVGFLIVKSTQWDNGDDDPKDTNTRDPLKFRILKKLNLIETYLQSTIAKPLPKRLKGEYITPAQAAQILDMIERLKSLVNSKL